MLFLILNVLVFLIHTKAVQLCVRHYIVNVYKKKGKKDNMGKLGEEGQLGERMSEN